MTAEVAILNKQAVAMAADSAVTTGNNKIFNTVNKLFALSKEQPVGIMMYSSAEIMGVPVETVVKEFRSQHGSNAESKLEHYAKAFDEFLRSDMRLFPAPSRRASMCDAITGVVSEIERRTLTNIETLLDPRSWAGPTSKQLSRAFDSAISEVERDLADRRVVVKLSRQRKLDLSAEIGDRCDRLIDALKEKYPVTRLRERKLRTLMLDSLLITPGYGGGTGIVIAGFGQNDIFPRLRGSYFRCSHEFVHNSHEAYSKDIASAGSTATIVPFAQSDVMSTLIEGKHYGYDRFVREFIDKYLHDTISGLPAALPNRAAIVGVLDVVRESLVSSLSNSTRQFTQESFVGPTMEVVATMPKEELALLAEALVNLTALKRKASRDAETVGGPTDVAVISKGDGFVWIKRKHYFDMKLNPSFGR